MQESKTESIDKHMIGNTNDMSRKEKSFEMQRPRQRSIEKRHTINSLVRKKNYRILHKKIYILNRLRRSIHQ